MADYIDVEGTEVREVKQENKIVTNTGYATAVAVMIPRERKAVLAACLEEAAIAGDEFFYSWTVTNSKTSKKSLVEGLSIQAAFACARNWGNCAVPIDVEKQIDAYVFTACFLDLETGFNLKRIFRQRKQANIGKYTDERSEDIIFQIGQSKALRNVILNALPSWLTSQVLTQAKEGVVASITKMGLPVAKEKTIAYFEKRGVSVERIELKLDKKESNWNVEDLAILRGAMNALRTSQETTDSLFPEAIQSGNTAEDLKGMKKAEKPGDPPLDEAKLDELAGEAKAGGTQPATETEKK